VRPLLITVCLFAFTTSASARSPSLEKLAQDRLEAARRHVLSCTVQYNSGHISMTDFLAATREVAFAARDSGLSGDALIKPLTEYRDSMKKSLQLTQMKYDHGAAAQSDLDAAQYALAEAEYWLAEAKEKK
jgi:hypothetical protein